MTNPKPLSEMIAELEPKYSGRMHTWEVISVDRASYDKLKAVAIELAKGLESLAVPYHDHDIIWDCKDVAGEYLKSAKDIIGGE